jgi:hypothetical protein
MKALIVLALLIGTANAQKITSATDKALDTATWIKVSDLGAKLLAHDNFLMGEIAGITVTDVKVCPQGVTFADEANMLGAAAMAYAHSDPKGVQQLEYSNGVADFIKAMVESEYPCK